MFVIKLDALVFEGRMLGKLKPLTEKSVHRSFSAGSTILFQGEVPRSAGVLLSGVVRVFSMEEEAYD